MVGFFQQNMGVIDGPPLSGRNRRHPAIPQPSMMLVDRSGTVYDCRTINLEKTQAFERLVGRNLHDIWPREYLVIIQHLLRAAFTSGKIQSTRIQEPHLVDRSSWELFIVPIDRFEAMILLR